MTHPLSLQLWISQAQIPEAPPSPRNDVDYDSLAPDASQAASQQLEAPEAALARFTAQPATAQGGKAASSYQSAMSA